MNVRPIGFMEYNNESKKAFEDRNGFFAAVTYDDGSVLYYSIEKAYDAKISDLFDKTGEKEGIVSIHIV